MHVLMFCLHERLKAANMHVVAQASTYLAKVVAEGMELCREDFYTLYWTL